MSQEEIQRLQRRADRERAARKQAEKLLEEKSLALYQSNLNLQELAGSLEALVAQRTSELEVALQKAEAGTRAKGDFLATMSHEIRTPLNGIIGTADLLRLSALDEEQREFVEIIHTSGNTLLVLINDILDFSKIEAGKLELELRPFNLRKELDSLLNLYRPLAQKRGLVLVCVTEPDIPENIVADSTRLRQILGNLISNSIKFTHEGKVTLHTTLKQMDDESLDLHFDVVDTGIGMSAEALTRLFQPFSQADSSTTRKYGGTGLGLAICTRLVEAMGGKMFVHSQPGSGTSFGFNILARPASVPLQQPVPENQGAQPSRSLSILLAEDHPVNQVLALKVLAKIGYQADLAENGKLAVELAQAKHYDLILMDMQMPELDGIEATKAIRLLPLDRQPRIVALTANAFDTDRQLCLDAGMDDFMSKPFKVDVIKAQLNLTAAALDALA